MSTRALASLAVLAVPAFQDNYLWLIHDGQNAAVVDPGASAPVSAALAANGLTLTAILLTHHHHDHIDGVPRLVEQWRVPVFGPRADGIAGIDVPLGEGDRVTVPGLALTLEVLDVPGHTRGHIAYLRGGDTPWLFCGDTLFGAGCGRVFNGTPQALAASLDKLATLPGNTLVYCAHEYTLSNLAFASAVDPHNAALQARVREDTATRAAGRATVPTSIARELATNPFLRYRDAAIAEGLRAAGRLPAQASAVEVFVALRAWKNVF